MKIPNRETLKTLREQHPEGQRVELVSMNDEYSTLVPGDQGVVKFVDDAGTIHVNWDQGSTLGVVYEVDEIKVPGGLS